MWVESAAKINSASEQRCDFHPLKVPIKAKMHPFVQLQGELRHLSASF